MNYPVVISLVACAVLVTGCASTDEENSNRAERHERVRRAAAQQEQAQQDEGQQNLESAQRNTINRDGNAMRY
jgi:hypothetical protein